MDSPTITGVHFLFTYRCSAACAHCFVWGSPKHRAVMPPADTRRYLDECATLGILQVSIEGGEPFTYYARLMAFVRECSSRGIGAGVLTNGFWATSPVVARDKLAPLVEAGMTSLLISGDEFHAEFVPPGRVEIVARVADELGVKVGRLTTTWENVMFRGRAAQMLAPKSPREMIPWEACTICHRESLMGPKRAHLDPYGLFHVCQGIVIGDARRNGLAEIIRSYDAETHPIVSRLTKGGPARLAELARETGFQPEAAYADECHLCYEARRFLRDRFPTYLGPNEMYGASGPSRREESAEAGS